MTRVGPPNAPTAPRPPTVVPSVVAALGAALVAVGAALPWVAIGRRNLSAFHLVTIARHFGYARSALAGALVTGWLFVPLLAGIAVASALLGRRRFTAGLAALVGMTGAVAAVFALRATHGDVLVGVWVTVAGSVLATVGALAGLLDRRR